MTPSAIHIVEDETSSAKATILVVEDERIIAMCIETQLKEMGYAVAGSASTGEDAVRKALELRPDHCLFPLR